MTIDKFQEIIQSCHLNFLIGSGCSMPYLKTLTSVETYLTEIDNNNSVSNDVKKIVKASILKQYFDDSICNNIEVLSSVKEEKCAKVLGFYSEFIKSLNNIILNRKSSILNKQVNLFTTNMDIFLEQSIEDLKVEFNDGFAGRINPIFSLSNFRKSIYKTTSHYDNISELPVFNLYKLHGSVSWKINEEKTIHFDRGLSGLKVVKQIVFKPGEILNLYHKENNKLAATKTVEELIAEAGNLNISSSHNDFLNSYELLPIVNPTKEKFKHTTLHYTYYELLRMFSNELEKENCVLFVMGFSFSDEHIREIILRSINSNPTLVVVIFSYDSISESIISNNLKLNDAPPKFGNLLFMPRVTETDTKEEKEHDLKNIVRYYFTTLSDKVSDQETTPV